MNVEIGAEAALFPEKENKWDFHCSVGALSYICARIFDFNFSHPWTDFSHFLNFKDSIIFELVARYVNSLS
jgi:hypothetical protein